MTAFELADETRFAEPGGVRAKEGADWPLAGLFFSSVLALYAGVGYLVYLLFL